MRRFTPPERDCYSEDEISLKYLPARDDGMGWQGRQIADFINELSNLEGTSGNRVSSCAVQPRVPVRDEQLPLRVRLREHPQGVQVLPG